MQPTLRDTTDARSQVRRALPLRMVSAPDVPEARAGAAGDDEAARRHEGLLLDAWREAHWALRLRLRDLMAVNGVAEVERLYDLARRADNELNDFYRARAEDLARQLRDAMVEPPPPPPSCGDHALPRFTPQTSSVLATIAAATARSGAYGRPASQPARAVTGPTGHDLTINERALVNRFRVMDADDRAALLRVAQRLVESTPPSR